MSEAITIQPHQPAKKIGPKRGLSLASFIVALIAPVIPGPGFIYSFIAAIIGHVAFVREKEARGWSIAGIILGWLGVLFSLLILFILIPLLGLTWEVISTFVAEIFESLQTAPQ